MNLNQLQSLCQKITQQTGYSCDISRSIMCYSYHPENTSIQWRFWIDSSREPNGEQIIKNNLSDLLNAIETLIKELKMNTIKWILQKNKPITTISKIEDQLYNNLPQATIIDAGIGKYEFWGQSGTDIQLVPELIENDRLSHTLSVTLQPDETIELILQQLQDLSFQVELPDGMETDVFPHIQDISYTMLTHYLILRIKWSLDPAI